MSFLPLTQYLHSQPVVLRNNRHGPMSNSADLAHQEVSGRLRDGVIGDHWQSAMQTAAPRSQYVEEETFGQARAKMKPATGIYRQYSPSECVFSVSQ